MFVCSNRTELKGENLLKFVLEFNIGSKTSKQRKKRELLELIWKHFGQSIDVVDISQHTDTEIGTPKKNKVSK